jgi:hypothetical protein
VLVGAKQELTSKRRGWKKAVWSLSTAKPGNGVEQLRDNNTDTYWQSDGSQPHLINIQFHKKMSIVEVSFFLGKSFCVVERTSEEKREAASILWFGC